MPKLHPSSLTTPAKSVAFLRRAPMALACLFLIALTLGFAVPNARAQGCIAVRNNPGTPLMEGGENIPAGKWVTSVSYRWFKSDRHFTGSREHPERQAQGTYVENNVHSVDFSATYAVNNRWSITLDVPYLDMERNSLYEHDRVTRHSMRSSGFGDARILADYWVFEPSHARKGNVAIGFGVKLPTGNNSVSDVSYRGAGGNVVRPVDPSIQLGDGGFGYVIQIQGYYNLAPRLTAFANASYMSTPKEQSSTEFTIADNPAYAAFIAPEIRHITIADQYSARAGLSYVVIPSKGISASLGGRIEGIPAEDIIGGDMGFRRPGYTISVEPGASWTFGKNTIGVNVPIAAYRNRVRSAPEKKLGRAGGDSAFADYSILVNYTRLW